MASIDKLKVSTQLWNTTKNPDGFIQFSDSFGSVARSLKHGNIIENFLDFKLRRKVKRRNNVPTFTSNDPDFDRPNRIDVQSVHTFGSLTHL